MSVSFTAGQLEWLRTRAFEKRTTPAELVRRTVAESRDRVSVPGAEPQPQLLASAVMLQSQLTMTSTGEERWHRLTVILAADQHHWLRTQAFTMHAAIAAVVRGCVTLAQGNVVGAGAPGMVPAPVPAGASAAAAVSIPARAPAPAAAAEGAVSRGRVRPSGPRRPARDESPRHMTVSLTPNLHQWLRVRAFDERTTAAELVRRYLDAARQRLDGEESTSLLSLSRR